MVLERKHQTYVKIKYKTPRIILSIVVRIRWAISNHYHYIFFFIMSNKSSYTDNILKLVAVIL